MSKETVLAAVNALPEEIEVNELIERLIFIEKVEEGFAAIERGDCKTHEEVKQIVQSWQK